MFKDDYRHQPPYVYHIGLSFINAKEEYFWEQPRGKVPLALKDTPFQHWNTGFPNINISDFCVAAAQTSNSLEVNVIVFVQKLQTYSNGNRGNIFFSTLFAIFSNYDSKISRKVRIHGVTVLQFQQETRAIDH